MCISNYITYFCNKMASKRETILESYPNNDCTFLAYFVCVARCLIVYSHQNIILSIGIFTTSLNCESFAFYLSVSVDFTQNYYNVWIAAYFIYEKCSIIELISKLIAIIASCLQLWTMLPSLQFKDIYCNQS